MRIKILLLFSYSSSSSINIKICLILHLVFFPYRFVNTSSNYHIKVRSVVRKERKESREIENERVKMESRGKLGNDEKVKFVSLRKSVKWREKTCGPKIYGNDHITLNFLIYFQATFLTL